MGVRLHRARLRAPTGARLRRSSASRPHSFVSDHRLYKLHRNGEPIEEVGPFEAEEPLIDALVELNRASQFAWGEVIVHVYETDATPLGIGRKYLGAIDGSTVLMMGEVDEDRVRDTR